MPLNFSNTAPPLPNAVIENTPDFTARGTKVIGKRRRRAYSVCNINVLECPKSSLAREEDLEKNNMRSSP
jgi:hypothetical protein